MTRLAAIIMFFVSATLPIACADDYPAKVSYPDGTEVRCELADTPIARNTGLSKHEELPEGTGMLFVYPKPRETSFWMPPEMRFSLDMIFLDKDRKIVHIAHDAPPCPDPKGWDCPSYSPDLPVSFVLEVPAGSARAHGLEIGDQLTITLPGDYKFPTR